jgi:hypothetical protein
LLLAGGATNSEEVARCIAEIYAASDTFTRALGTPEYDPDLNDEIDRVLFGALVECESATTTTVDGPPFTLALRQWVHYVSAVVDARVVDAQVREVADPYPVRIVAVEVTDVIHLREDLIRVPDLDPGPLLVMEDLASEPEPRFAGFDPGREVRLYLMADASDATPEGWAIAVATVDATPIGHAAEAADWAGALEDRLRRVEARAVEAGVSLEGVTSSDVLLDWVLDVTGQPRLAPFSALP